MTEVERKTREKEGREERKRGCRERERSRASCSHYLTYYTGSMPPRPSRGPTSLHLASLGSPFALLTGLPSASSFCLPPAVLPLTPSHTRRLLSPPRLSRHARARARESPAPRPPSRSRTPSFLFHLQPLPLLLYRRLLSRVSTSPSSSLPALSSFSCSLFLLVRPHRAFSSTVRVRGHEAPLRIISSRLPRLALTPLSLSLLRSLCSFFFLFPLSFCLLSFRRLFFLRPLFDVLSFSPPPPRLWTRRPPLAVSLLARARGINYSKNLYCYYYRLTIPSALKPETCIRVQYNARLCSRPADYVNPTTARATTATTGRRCLVPLR